MSIDFEKIKTFADVLQATGKTEEEIYQGDLSERGRAQKRVEAMIELVNDDPGFPDWKNRETKYQPWFDMSSGSGLSYRDYASAHSFSGVGSRLCFNSRPKLVHTVKYFIEDYKIFMTK